MFDVIILGGGIMGVSIADKIIRNTNLTIALFEQGEIGNSGATKDSGGFIRMYDSNINHTKMNLLSLNELISLKKEIEYIPKGHLYILQKKDFVKYIPSLKLMQKFHYPLSIFDKLSAGETFKEVHIDNDEILIWEPLSGYANPKKAAKFFQSRFVQNGGFVFENTKVDSIEYNHGISSIQTNKGTFKSKKIIICLGAWNKSFMKTHSVNCQNKLIEVSINKFKSNQHICFNDQQSGLYSRPMSDNHRLIGIPQDVYDIDPDEKRVFNKSFFDSQKTTLESKISGINNSTFIEGITSFDSFTQNEIPEVMKLTKDWTLVSGFNGSGFKTFPIISEFVNQIY